MATKSISNPTQLVQSGVQKIQSQLIPVSPGFIGNVACLTINGRALHATLGVRRDFSTWMKGRISKYGFQENQDFEVFTNSGENSEGGRPSQEYTLALDMGKELCMVENNEAGKVARRYFIECERKAIQAAATPPTPRTLPAFATHEERTALDKLVKVWASLVGGDSGVYARLNTQVNSHVGIAQRDSLTSHHARQAISFVQERIDELQAKVQAIDHTHVTALPAPSATEIDTFLAQCRGVRSTFDDLRVNLDNALRPHMKGQGIQGKMFLGNMRSILSKYATGICADMMLFEEMVEAAKSGVEPLQ